MVKRYGCCGVPWRKATILLLSGNIIINCFAVSFSFLYDDEIVKKGLFSDKVESSMAYIFVLIEAIVLLNAIISTFKKKTSMLTCAIVMLLLESFFIILVAVRIHYKNILKEFWQKVLKAEFANLEDGTLKEAFKSEGESVPLVLTVALCSIFSFILILKISCAMVVNSYKNHTEVINLEDTFYRMKSGRERPLSRPTSYVYSTLVAGNDKNLYQ